MGRPKVEAHERRSVTLSTASSEKVKYLADVAARYNQQSLSAFIEKAIKRALSPEAMNADEATPGKKPKDVEPKLWNEDELWSEDAAVRLYNLVFFDTEGGMLTADEERLWRAFTVAMDKAGKKTTKHNFVEYYHKVSSR